MKAANGYLGLLSKLAPLLFLIVGLACFPFSIMGWNLEFIPGDLGDARFNNYIFEHGHQYLFGWISDYWNAPFMYPYPNVIAFSDNLLGTLPVYSGFRILGFDKESAFQLWIAAMFVLNYGSMYFCLKRWFNHPVIAISGAYIFTFSIFILGNIYNIQTLPRFISPWVLYFVWKWTQSFKIKDISLAFAGVVFQFYCGIYLGLILLIVIAVFALLCLGFTFKNTLKQFKAISLKKVLLVLGYNAPAAALLVLLMLPYIEVAGLHGYPDYKGLLRTVPELSSYFFTSEAPLLWSFLSEHGKNTFELWWCHHLFPGAIPIIALFLGIVVCLRNPKHSRLKLWVLTTIILVLLTLKIGEFSLYKIIYLLPGFSAMRSINRFLNIEIILFILILAELLLLVKQSKGAKYLWILPILLILDNAVDSEKIMRFEKAEAQKRVADLKDKIGSQHPDSNQPLAYVNELFDRSHYAQLDMMHAAQDLERATINAYTGSFPRAYDHYLKHLDPIGLKIWSQSIRLDLNKVDLVYEYPTLRKVGFRSVVSQSWISSDHSNFDYLRCDRDNFGEWEQFYLIEAEDATYQLLSHQAKAVDGSDNELLKAAAPMDSGAAFNLINLGGDTVIIHQKDRGYWQVNDSLYVGATEIDKTSATRFILTELEE